MMTVTANNYQVKRRIFPGWADDREAAWLSAMSREGWHLVAMRYGFSYHFLKGEPKNYVYQLDYQYNLADENEYLGIFEAAGWEYLGEFINWRYFRQVALPGEHLEIYSDPHSKVERNRRIRNVFMTIFIANLVAAIMNFGVFLLPKPGHFNANLTISMVNIGAALLLFYGISKINARNRHLQQLGPNA